PEALKRKARALRRRLANGVPKGFHFQVVASSSRVGGGALPEEALPTFCVAVTPLGMSETELEKRLRASDPPVIARVEEGKVLLDVRTLLEGDAGELVHIFSEFSHAD
ncbi:MAG: L-seryl-tRNA(Sec) selenium transferase, partial [Deltaproteobacteria bacterium]